MPSNRESHALLSVVRCSVHGQIDLDDVTPGTQIIKRLVVSAPIQRLRRIKQLGFASLEYTGADHSRFSHAVGTMHVTRTILAKPGEKMYLNAVAEELREDVRSRESAEQHLLVAALLQDCGELPYGIATGSLLRPNEEVLKSVRELTGENAADWPSEAVFLLACLDELQSILDDLDIEVLAYLMTGRYWKSRRPALHPAMHLLDGVVDADRIDYVRRDAHHVGLGHVDVRAIVDSLLDFDAEGPVCSDPAPIASLLALRAHLYSTVYYSAPNRFRVMLLRELLSDVLTSPSNELRSGVLGTEAREVSYSRFLELDDVEVDRSIAKANDPNLKKQLGDRAQKALEVLSGTNNDYSERWLTTSNPAPDGKSVPLPVRVFGEIFEAKSYPDQRRVRVRLDPNSAPVDLETLNGPYSGVVADTRAQLPIRGDVLVFEPARFRQPKDYRDALAAGWLGAGIRAGLIAGGGIAHTDTRDTPEFTGPAIFISYCTDDLLLVSALVGELYRRRRRYYLIAGAYQGVGGTPGNNSERAPRETDACIMVVSPAYQKRITEQTTGNIAKEMAEVRGRRENGSYPLVALSTTSYRNLDLMPWGLLGFPDEAPFVGSPLTALDFPSVSQAIEAALTRIDADAVQHAG